MNLYSAEAEQSVIGACMLNEKVTDRLSDRLRAADFASPANQHIWRAIIALRNRQAPLDVVTLSEELETGGLLQDVGGIGALAEYARCTPSWSNAEHYADVVLNLSQRRKIDSYLAEIGETVRDRNLAVSEVVDSAQSKLSSVLSASTADVGPIGNYLEEFVDNLDAKWRGDVDPMGIGFGVRDLDSMTMGMHPSNLVVVGARPKIGKTIFGMNALRSCVLESKRPAVMFSMEMSKQELLVRMSAAISQVPQDAIKDPRKNMTDDYWARIPLTIQSLKDAPMIIDDRPGLTPSQVRGAAKRWKEHYGDMGLVVVDYIGLMKPDGKHGTREREVAEISGAMKGLAKELGCPVLALSQLNRGVEQRPNKRPMMSDLRESGSLEQDADIIIFLYADEEYNPDTENKGVIELIVAAQRAGRTGTAYAARRLDVARIDSLAPEMIMAAKNSSKATDDGFSV